MDTCIQPIKSWEKLDTHPLDFHAHCMYDVCFCQGFIGSRDLVNHWLKTLFLRSSSGAMLPVPKILQDQLVSSGDWNLVS